jgi:hypothetical protein
VKRKAGKAIGGFDLVGEAVHVVATAPIAVLAVYYAGSVPFVLGFLYYWSEMSRSAFAADRCLGASLLLALLFVWMKSWQAGFAAALSAHIRGHRQPPWPARRILRLVLMQTMIQPLGLVLIPMAVAITNGFFQSFSVIADGKDLDLASAVKRSCRQAALWPRQNVIAMWLLSPWILSIGIFIAFTAAWFALRANPDLQTFGGIFWFLVAFLFLATVVLPLSPFGCVVASNIAAVIILVPILLKTFLGIETTFALGGMHAVLNTTFVITVVGLAYLCMDPFAKAAYALRCFYGESRRTGEDLMVELRLLDPQGAADEAMRDEREESP